MASRNKRRRLVVVDDTETHANGAAVLPEVIGELDLEIRLRQRLVDTIESRITWALCLQQAMEQGIFPVHVQVSTANYY